MEGTRDTLTARQRMTPWWQRLGYRVLGHHRLLLVGSTLLAVAQRLHLVPKRMGLPKLAAAPWPAARVDRRRHVAVHRLRHGRVAARRPIATPPRCSTRSVSPTARPGPAERAAGRCTSMPA